MDRIYLIKNLNVWMLDELIAFSQHVRFKVIFIRKPGDFFNDKLAKLEGNGIKIVYAPFTNNIDIKKVWFCLGFVFRNIFNFFSGYSFVVGVKSVWWFLRLDDTPFKKPVSIHAQFATQPALIALLLSKYHSTNQIDYYFTFHAYDIFFKNRWFAKLANNSKKCFSISEFNINYVLQKFKDVNPAKVELNRLGAFSDEVEHQNKPTDGILKLGFISWFVEKKGTIYLLEAMKRIASSNKNIKLIMAGDGPQREEIEEFIRSNKLTDSINYIGKINSEQKKDFFRKIDALVLPAITLPDDMDGIPVVLMEAISYGLPLISTNVSGIPEICINDYNGYLIPEKDVGALVEAINSLYNNKMLIDRFSENSLQLFNDYKIEKNSYNKLKKLEWIN